MLVAASGLVVRLSLSPSRGYLAVDGDLVEHKQAMHVALTQGLGQIYGNNPRADPAETGGEWTGGYFANQPPVIYLLRYPAVALYRWLSPAGFEAWPESLNMLELSSGELDRRLRETRGFTVALKVPGILADVVIALGLFALARPRAGDAAALAALASYSWNPGIVLDTAFWGQGDAVAAAFTLLALAALSRGRIELAWGAGALAVLTKPQAAAYVPLLVALGAAYHRGSRIRGAALAAAGLSLLVFLPFLWSGTFWLAVRALWVSTVGGEPFVSCQAANLWWLLSGGDGYGWRDDRPLLAFLTPRLLGLAGVLAVNAALVLDLKKGADPDGLRLLRAAALAGLSFFMLATELHENHMMAVIPLVILVAALDGRWLVPAALSLTFLANLVLFDPALAEPVGAWVGVGLAERPLSLAIAAVNTVVWGFLLAGYFRAPAPGRA